MRILCYSDNHFCEKSSIITKYGTKYTQRLENQLASLNWAEKLAKSQKCDLIVCLGDFFDKAHLTDQEITALHDINWAKLPHYFLVGNHESEENDLQYSSTMALIAKNFNIISEATLVDFEPSIELAFLPYVVETNRKPITEYFSARGEKLRILFSHTDIAGLQLGPIVSKTGFSCDELERVCDICINGHLHNGSALTGQVINIGNLTGKDFGEDASRYAHGVLILDTDALKVDFIENPFAFNFYKLDIEKEADLKIVSTLKNNAIVSLRCKSNLVMQARTLLEQAPNIIESRIIVVKDAQEPMEEVDISTLMVDQCAKFAECCRSKLDNSEILEAELAEILK